MRLAEQARLAGRLTAYSPLVSAELAGPSVDGAPADIGALAESLLASGPLAVPRSQLGRYA
jgi:hypothetical protein